MICVWSEQGLQVSAISDQHFSAKRAGLSPDIISTVLARPFLACSRLAWDITPKTGVVLSNNATRMVIGHPAHAAQNSLTLQLALILYCVWKMQIGLMTSSFFKKSAAWLRSHASSLLQVYLGPGDAGEDKVGYLATTHLQAWPRSDSSDVRCKQLQCISDWMEDFVAKYVCDVKPFCFFERQHRDGSKLSKIAPEAFLLFMFFWRRFFFAETSRWFVRNSLKTFLSFFCFSTILFGWKRLNDLIDLIFFGRLKKTTICNRKTTEKKQVLTFLQDYFILSQASNSRDCVMQQILLFALKGQRRVCCNGTWCGSARL